MPKAFDNCVKAGGTVRTRSLPNGKYQRICIKDGKTYAGYVEKKGSGKSAHKKKPKSTKFGDLYG